uniref:Pre-mRNA-processing factor 17 n=1 Tax=Eutreptiella gymnastica TaxID=73025 RepID=A0A7S4C8Y7_9EUGL
MVARKEGNALSLEGDEDREGLTVYFEEDEKRGVRIARYEAIEPKSLLHRKEIYDYQGRSFLHDPLRDSDLPSFIPKKTLHTYTGHNKGVQCIRWFPPHGHLLLSGGLDGKVKLWDVCAQRDVIQTYIGHAKAVKDLCFSNDGARFVSAGFDRFMREWDTETGAVLGTYTTGKQPHVVKIHPDDGKQSIFLVGMGDKKIVQWDTRSGVITQEYDQHLGPVNTIQFIDNNSKFVTTGDDKTVRVWEWDIPFAIKYMADPGMHSMPTCTVHPSGKYIAYQSMDNQIKIYTGGERFRPYSKKTFKGHVSSGYACQVAWSPDGKYLCCGDGEGFVWFWEWKSSKIVKKIKFHEKVCIGLLWHPVEQSRMASCSWDATVKLWD